MKHPLKFNVADHEKWAKKIKVNKDLDEKYKGVILFPEKLERAKEILKKVKLPK